MSSVARGKHALTAALHTVFGSLDQTAVSDRQNPVAFLSGGWQTTVGPIAIRL